MKSNCSKFVVLAAFAVALASGSCRIFSATETAKAKEIQSVDVGKLQVRLHSQNENEASAVVEYFNGTQSTLWFPIEQNPGYRQDANSKVISIWFGYFDDVHGLHKGQYILPAMRPLRPGETLQFELTSPVLARIVMVPGSKKRIGVRVATKAFSESRVRNEQPFEDYIANSIVFFSEE